MASVAPSPLVPDSTCLRLDQIEASSSTITVIVTTTAAKAHCPVCQNLSERVHSRYVRRVADLPWMGWLAPMYKLTSPERVLALPGRAGAGLLLRGLLVGAISTR